MGGDVARIVRCPKFIGHLAQPRKTGLHDVSADFCSAVFFEKCLITVVSMEGHLQCGVCVCVFLKNWSSTIIYMVHVKCAWNFHGVDSFGPKFRHKLYGSRQVMARCKDDLEDVEVQVEEGEALAAKSGSQTFGQQILLWTN